MLIHLFSIGSIFFLLIANLRDFTFIQNIFASGLYYIFIFFYFFEKQSCNAFLKEIFSMTYYYLIHIWGTI